MHEATPEPGLSIHRSEALTDGIYAVAMTLLVIELKLPEHLDSHSSRALADALLGLLPRVYAWVLSFGVLAIFWLGHHRAFSGLRRADGRLVTYNIAQLACVSLMPFSCAVLGAHGTVLAQAVYAGNMVLLAVCSLLTVGHIHAHPALSAVPMTRGRYRAARIRIGGLIAVSAATVALQAALPEAPGIGNAAFALMGVIVPLSRRSERADAAASARAEVR